VRLARIHPRGSKDEQGYVLLLMLFLAAMLIIAMTASAPYLTTQIKRDREIEMIHRGEQYARAVKRYYRKFGRYPGRVEDLEKTNNIRFLRKRYKDPMSPDGSWRLVRFGEVQLGGGTQSIAGATPASNLQGGSQPGSSFGGGGSTFGSGSSSGSSFGSSSGSSFGSNSGSSFGSSGSSFGGSQNPSQAGASGTDTSNSGTTAQSSSLFGQQITGGAGAIIGVASTSKKTGLHEFNKKSAYKDWLFVYDATRDKGQLIKGPFNPNAFVGQFNNVLGGQGAGGMGQPAGGMQGGPNNNGSSFGNPSGSFGNPSGGMGTPTMPQPQPPK
jgi:type II secretory pathway pseudopilin PulG